MLFQKIPSEIEPSNPYTSIIPFGKIPQIDGGETLCEEEPEPQSCTYVVKPCEKLSDIGEQLSVVFKELREVNPYIYNPNMLRPGQIIQVPTGAAGHPDVRCTP